MKIVLGTDSLRGTRSDTITDVMIKMETNNKDEAEFTPLFFIKTAVKTCVFSGNYKTDSDLIEAAQDCARVFPGKVEIKSGNPVFVFPEYDEDTEIPSWRMDGASCAFAQQVLPMVWLEG